MFDDEVETAMAESRQVAHEQVFELQADFWSDPDFQGDLG